MEYSPGEEPYVIIDLRNSDETNSGVAKANLLVNQFAGPRTPQTSKVRMHAPTQQP